MRRRMISILLLLCIVMANPSITFAAEEKNAENVSISQRETKAEGETKTGSEAKVEDEIETGSEAKAEDEAKTGSEAQVEDETKAGSEAQVEDEAKAGSETKVEDKLKADGDIETLGVPETEVFSITYELDGGDNQADNPTTYTAGIEIVLKAPTKSGYVFGGWYTDNEFKNDVQMKISKENTGNITLYAKWNALINISDVTILSVDDQPYTGQEIKPPVVMTCNGVELKENIDYSLSYSNHINPGTATITITGIGIYVGTGQATFKIIVKIDAVKGLKQASNTENTIKLSWKRASAASGYKIYRYDTKKGTYDKIATTKQGDAVTYTNKKLNPGTTYQYKVRAYQTINGKNYDASEDSPVVKMTTKPKKIAKVKQETNSTSSIKLSWKKVGGASGYEIYRYQTKTKKYTKIASTKKNSAVTYTNKKLSSATIYKYKVRAYKILGTKTNYGSFSPKITVATKPTKPKLITATSGKASEATIKWSKAARANGYELFQNGGKIATIESGKTVEYTVGGLTGNKTYSYKVRAFKKVNGKKVYGAFSKSKAVLIKEAKPLGGFKIGIDAGHQAKGNAGLEPVSPGSSILKPKVSSGTTGRYTGIPEYQVNLSVALLLEAKLKALGAEVVMIRTTHDVNIPNSERATRMNEAGVDLCIRIHADGNNNSSVYGTSMFVPAKETSPSIADASYQAGQKILQSYVAATGAKNNGVSLHTDMTGFNWSTVPVCLIELGFMTNEAEDRLLVSPQYQEKCAQGLANGILAWCTQ
ncbi:N-acetylmuramoyl-L-alanine amidase [Lachnospiraceae bacterium ZAX-1]